MKKNGFFHFLFLVAGLQVVALPNLVAEQDHWKAEEYYQNSSSQKDAAADLLKYVSIKPSQKILDVGCGDGKITAEIATQIPMGSITGVDISSSMIDFAKGAFRDRYQNLSFFLKDAQSLDYNEEFDTVFSFTTLQWIQNHEAFLAGAYKSLKQSGTLAITMPMGLPVTLEQAVNECMAQPEWGSYFQEFSTGWNFVEENEYKNLVLAYHFTPSRFEVVPQKDIFPSREVFENLSVSGSLTFVLYQKT